jgi:hypothetical protein
MQECSIWIPEELSLTLIPSHIVVLLGSPLRIQLRKVSVNPALTFIATQGSIIKLQLSKVKSLFTVTFPVKWKH